MKKELKERLEDLKKEISALIQELRNPCDEEIKPKVGMKMLCLKDTENKSPNCSLVFGFYKAGYAYEIKGLSFFPDCFIQLETSGENPHKMDSFAIYNKYKENFMLIKNS